MTMDEVTALLRERREMLMADLAIHCLMDLEEARSLVQPLVESGRVERFWRPMGSPLRVLCDCDREEVLRWRGE